MLTQSSIEWTNATWNPVTGCSKISPGCDHCYADRMAKRLQAMGVHKYRNGFNVTIHPESLDAPLRWKKPQLIFVNSMSDLFHEDIPFEFVEQIFDVMGRASHHVFQILTKRSKRLKRLHKQLPWPSNVWMGVTVESEQYAYRIKDLRQTNAAVKFLSLEPLLGPLSNLDMSGINWAIVGGESGPGARPMDSGWVKEIRRQCRDQKVGFFFKQWGGVNKKKTGRELDGKVYDAMPSGLSKLAKQSLALPLAG
jgi:protein gp37